jgi:hypothetical protein
MRPCLDEVVRVSEVPKDVSTAEVNLILWLILEREFGNYQVVDAQSEGGRRLPLQVRTTQCDGGSGGRSHPVGSPTDESGSDNVDSVSVIMQQSGRGHSRRQRRKSVSQQQRARKCEELEIVIVLSIEHS